jgi:uncharacterized protein YjbJ (UPF0337 family)
MGAMDNMKQKAEGMADKLRDKMGHKSDDADAKVEGAADEVQDTTNHPKHKLQD